MTRIYPRQLIGRIAALPVGETNKMRMPHRIGYVAVGIVVLWLATWFLSTRGWHEKTSPISLKTEVVTTPSPGEAARAMKQIAEGSFHRAVSLRLRESHAEQLFDSDDWSVEASQSDERIFIHLSYRPWELRTLNLGNMRFEYHEGADAKRRNDLIESAFTYAIASLTPK